MKIILIIKILLALWKKFNVAKKDGVVTYSEIWDIIKAGLTALGIKVEDEGIVLPKKKKKGGK